MNHKKTDLSRRDLAELCSTVRAFVIDGNFDACTTLISHAMECCPHAPEPHNLMGIVLEKVGDHAAAMKHFRAALALDPSYRPAAHNLNTYGTFYSRGSCAFDESDVPSTPSGTGEDDRDTRSCGRLVYRAICGVNGYGIDRAARR